MSDKVKGFILLSILVILSAFASSWITLHAANQLFSLNVDVSFANVIALTWLILVVKGIVVNNISVEK